MGGINGAVQTAPFHFSHPERGNDRDAFGNMDSVLPCPHRMAQESAPVTGSAQTKNGNISKPDKIPSGLWSLSILTPGSSFLAALGLMLQSLWHWEAKRQQLIKIAWYSTENSEEPPAHTQLTYT